MLTAAAVDASTAVNTVQHIPHIRVMGCKRVVGTVWFLQRNDNGEVRALEQDHALATPEERNRFDLALSELVERIKEAAENRPAVTGWRIGEDPNLPLLVTDANRLQDFYRAAAQSMRVMGLLFCRRLSRVSESPEQDPSRSSSEGGCPVKEQYRPQPSNMI